MDLHAQKKEIRDKFLTKREELKKNFTRENKKQLISNVFKLANNFNYDSVAGYFPIGSEIDCLEILEKFNYNSIITALPFVKEDKNIEFRIWNKSEVLEDGLFKIPVPKKRIIVIPDIIIIPLISFDKTGSRIGFGSGIYDRSLPSFPKSKKIGLAFSGQLNKRVIPIGEFDQKLDAVATEKDILFFK